MAKKPRSQRRHNRKGGGGDDADDDNHLDADELPEDFTIAGSANSLSVWEGENDDDDGAEDLIGNSVSERGALAAAARRTKLGETLTLLDEFTTEKRSATRETRLRRIFKGLTQYVAGEASTELVWGCQESLRTACLYSLRAGSAAEQYAACRVLEATAVVLQGDQEEWIQSIAPVLHRTVQIASRAAVVRASALRAWALSVFIGSGEMEDTHAVLDVCEDVAQIIYRNEPVPTALRAAALDCWTLLATTLTEYAVAGNDDVSHGRGLTLLPLLKDCLESNETTSSLSSSSSSQLRTAAGECVALIHECRLSLSDDSGEKNTTERKFQQGSWEGTEWEVVMDEIRQSVSELAQQSGHYMSKKAKKAQRATFREYVATIVDDEAPEEVVAMRNEGSLTLTSWKEIVQLGFIRAALQGGLQIQLMTNETLRIMFGVQGGVKADGLSSLEKRLFFSKASEAAKEADRKLTKNRDKRERVKHHFLTADGEDM
uniref:Interferon-related developmental regulator N-terminal domain-containing protein n=1 Tax=Amphora coffeiformis TaxID=265554 RepID=A0A7S3L515_9STRA|mmetsp:Transcript_25810/g.48834  ORF Transcript_25810/g.48834 Transcript_25810/m.48834 type:complete len:488 (+) Transcript_25810:182-1645(+)|eukprot:scaffold1690_cov182-Amphora_coffeaeformis.AAC.82